MFEQQYPIGPKLVYSEVETGHRRFRLYPRYFGRDYEKYIAHPKALEYGWASSNARVLDYIWGDMYRMCTEHFPQDSWKQKAPILSRRYRTWRFVVVKSGQDNYFEFATKSQALLVKLALSR